jgi:hypothetical protein
MARTSTDTEASPFQDTGDSPAELVLIEAWKPVRLALRRVRRANERYGPESREAQRARERATLKTEPWIELAKALANVGLIRNGWALTVMPTMLRWALWADSRWPQLT